MLVSIIKTIFEYGALVFAISFLMPLFAQLIVLSAWTPPAGLSPLAVGAVPALILGIVAQVRGTWLWQR